MSQKTVGEGFPLPQVRMKTKPNEDEPRLLLEEDFPRLAGENVGTADKRGAASGEEEAVSVS